MNCSGNHLTIEQRHIIEHGVTNGSTKAAIAETLGKEKSTIGKEIKQHRTCTYRCPLPLECVVYKTCTHNRECKLSCPDFKQFHCKRRDRSPGVCNGCNNYSRCRFTKFRYSASDAHAAYREQLHYSREGFNITQDEVVRIGNIIEPLLKKGQSLESILMNHPEIQLSVQTLYTYVESNLFKSAVINIGALDLRRQVSRKIPKSKRTQYKVRNDRSYLQGRTYKEFVSLVSSDEPYSIVEMDTVYNDVQNGPFIQTFLFVKYSFLFGVLHQQKTAEAMNMGVLLLEQILGPQLFQQHAQIILTDRGAEFVQLPQIETRNSGEKRCSFFYCDPMQSSQKPHVENKHEELRYILPKSLDLEKIGLRSQEDLNWVMTQINSSPRKRLSGKSPLEVMEFYHPDLVYKFNQFGITQLPKDEVVLTPAVLSSRNR